MIAFLEFIKSLFNGSSDFERGFAHGRLCAEKGKEAVLDLLEKIDTAREYDEYNDFDRGAEEALRSLNMHPQQVNYD